MILAAFHGSIYKERRGEKKEEPACVRVYIYSFLERERGNIASDVSILPGTDRAAVQLRTGPPDSKYHFENLSKLVSLCLRDYREIESLIKRGGRTEGGREGGALINRDIISRVIRNNFW